MTETEVATAANPHRDIILAALNMTGPVPVDEDGNPDKAKWDKSLRENAVDIAVLTSGFSPLSKTLATLESCKKFTGTIEGVLKEAKSTRGFVAFKTKVSQWAKDGYETGRTERTDSGQEAVDLANKLRALRGHRVLVWVDMQQTTEGQKVRVVKHVEDLGIDEDWDLEAGQQIAADKLAGKQITG